MLGIASLNNGNGLGAGTIKELQPKLILQVLSPTSYV